MDSIWLVNKLYSFYGAAVVGIINRRSLNIDGHHENQPNILKALYKPSIHFNSGLKWLYISSKMECISYEGVCGMTRIEAFEKKS